MLVSRIFLCSLLALANTTLLHAQRPGPAGALVVSAGTNQQGAEPNAFSAFSLEYRRSRKSGNAYRIGLTYGRAEESAAFAPRALGVDTYSVLSQYRLFHYVGLTGALEKERSFGRKVSMVAGLEARVSYGFMGNVENRTEFYAGGQSFSPTQLPPSGNGYSGPDQTLSLHARPYLGARVYPGSRLLLGIDFGPALYNSVMFGGTGNGSTIDLNLQLVTCVVRLGFRF